MVDSEKLLELYKGIEKQIKTLQSDIFNIEKKKDEYKDMVENSEYLEKLNYLKELKQEQDELVKTSGDILNELDTHIKNFKNYNAILTNIKDNIRTVVNGQKAINETYKTMVMVKGIAVKSVTLSCLIFIITFVNFNFMNSYKNDIERHERKINEIVNYLNQK